MPLTETAPTWTCAKVTTTWRRQQAEALEGINESFINGRTRTWVVMPPGSGKTLVGLEVIRRQGRKALVLSPNTAIQSQWASSGGMFTPALPVTTVKSFTAPITALTYQSIALFADPDTSNGHIPRLHQNGKQIVASLAAAGELLIVLDEAHHLLATWGELVAEILDQVPNAHVLGLTGTPPQNMTAREADLFDRILGEVAYVASPNAVIRDGGTAPYQDLHYFVEPTIDEKNVIAANDKKADKITAASVAKAIGAANILEKEHNLRGEHLRALVLTDFETMQGKDARVGSGSAEQVIRALTTDPFISKLEPVMVTGSRVMCSAPTARGIVRWLNSNYPQFHMDSVSEYGDTVVEITGAWTSREWVPALTEWFQKNNSHVLVGTRSLLGEGWDAPAVNVVIDLTAASTPVSVAQARGRGLRIDKSQPGKVASLWTVTCIDPGMTDRAPDYVRLQKKSSTYFTAFRGAVVQGTSIIPSLATIRSKGVDAINAVAFMNATKRDDVLSSWRVGEGYRDKQCFFVEVARQNTAVVALRYLGVNGWSRSSSRLVMKGTGAAARPVSEHTVAQSIAAAVASTLYRLGSISASYDKVRCIETASGSLRVWLDSASKDDAVLFQKVFAECFDLSVPADAPHYPAHAIAMDVFHSQPLLPTGKTAAINPMTSYHPIPTTFAKNLGARDVYHDEWNRWVSPTDVEIAGSTYAEWTGGAQQSRRWI